MLPISTEPMFAVVIIYLHSLRKVRIGGKIRRTHALKIAEHFKVGVRITPYTGKLIIVYKEMKPLIKRDFASLSVVKAYKGRGCALFRKEARYIVNTRTVKYAFVQILIVASLSVHDNSASFHNAIIKPTAQEK